MKMPPFPHDLKKLSDYELGGFILGYFIAAQAVKLGVDPDDLPDQIQEQILINILSEDTDDDKIAPLEKALQKAASGDFERAGKIFRGHFKSSAVMKAALDEVATGRRRQQKYAKEKRTDNLQKLIMEIVKNKPHITKPELLKKLKKLEHVNGSVIDEIIEHKNKIYYIGNDGKGGQEAKISGLKDRLYRAKKN